MQDTYLLLSCASSTLIDGDDKTYKAGRLFLPESAYSEPIV